MQIPKGTKFIGVVKNTDSYDFCTWENATLLKDDESKYYATLYGNIQMSDHFNLVDLMDIYIAHLSLVIPS